MEQKLRKAFFIFIILMFLVALFVALFFTAFASGQVAPTPNTFVYLYDEIMIASTDAPDFDGQVLTETKVIEGRTFWVTPVVTGTHIINGTSYTFDLLNPGESYAGGNFDLTANPEDWGRVGVVAYGSDTLGQVYTLAGYGYSSGFPNGSMWWNGQVWGENPVYGFLMMVWVPTLQPTPEPTPTTNPPVGYSLFLTSLYKAPSVCEGVNPVEPYGVYGQDGLVFDYEVNINGKYGMKFDLADGKYLVYPSGCIGTSYEVVLTTGDYADNVVTFTQKGGEIYVVTYPNNVYTVNGVGYDTTLDWGKYSLQFWNTGTMSWQSGPLWDQVTNLKFVVK